MATPYSDNLHWNAYTSNPEWHTRPVENTAIPVASDSQTRHAVKEVFNQAFKQPVVQGVQFVRDLARLVLKVPIRAIRTPIFLSKNWQAREHAVINVKLTGYSLVRFAAVPAKLLVAIAVVFTSVISKPSASWLLDKSGHYSALLNGRASQLEALKEEGLKHTATKCEYLHYKQWIYNIDPKLCR